MSIVGAVAVPHPPIIIPEIGRGEEAKIEATTKAYEAAADFIRTLNPDTIVITSPHATAYTDYFHISPGRAARGDFSRFGAGSVQIQTSYDEEFVKTLSAEAEKANLPAGTLGEREPQLDHGTLVPLYFLRNAGLSAVPTVRIGLSGLSDDAHYRLGQLIAKTAEKLNRRVVMLGSGDLSHKLREDGPYGFAEEGPVLDARIQEIFADADFLSLLQLSPQLREASAECGVGCFEIMAGALDGLAVKGELLSYEGPFGVGYGIATFTVEGPADSRRYLEQFQMARRREAADRKAHEDAYVQLARAALESYIHDGKVIDVPPGLPDEMYTQRAGTFVSLKKHGRLRGCIGTISATKDSLAKEIIANALNAGTDDPRFPPVTADELPELVYSVDVLGESEPAQPADLDAERYGVIVTNGWRRGLLLPNLEGVDSPQEQISIALSKAGISPEEPYSIERFEVVRHK